MADKVSVAIRQSAALERIQTAIAALSERYELPDVDLQPSGRDPALVRAVQLEAVATLLEELVIETAPDDTAPKNALPNVEAIKAPAAPGKRTAK